MPPSNGSTFVEATIDPRRGWLVVKLQSGFIEFDASPTFFPRSRMSSDLTSFLTTLGHAHTLGPNQYRLDELTLGGRPVADLDVAVSELLGRAQVHAMLGLDFLSQFTEITLDLTPDRLSVRLTFVVP